MTLEVGTRVRVEITKTEGWSIFAIAALNGMTGTIESVKPNVDAWDRPRKQDSPYCVRFDTPAPKWWSNQSPCLAFHFDAHDLVVLP
jgi:hypothetical protein